LVSERPEPKQVKLVDKTPGATTKHNELKIGNDTIAVDDVQGHTKVENVSTIPNQLNFTKPPLLWRFCELSSKVRPIQLS
jgi:hypothetical protein